MKLSPSHGNVWADEITEDGTVKAFAFYIEDKDGDAITLSLDEATELVASLPEAVKLVFDARDAKLKEIEEALPTERGLYVHPRYARDVEQLFTASVYKLNHEGWYELTASQGSTPVPDERMRAIKKGWGGLVPLRAVKED